MSPSPGGSHGAGLRSQLQAARSGQFSTIAGLRAGRRTGLVVSLSVLSTCPSSRPFEAETDQGEHGVSQLVGCPGVRLAWGWRLGSIGSPVTKDALRPRRGQGLALQAQVVDSCCR